MHSIQFHSKDTCTPMFLKRATTLQYGGQILPAGTLGRQDAYLPLISLSNT